ncbi:MAG TPA: hypothetical protein VFF69_00940 [Phycisphaerales bacterium]|nr:hypothetical protein [Phycisphaerales bacterium]
MPAKRAPATTKSKPQTRKKAGAPEAKPASKTTAKKPAKSAKASARRAAPPSEDKAGGISDEAVVRATGRTKQEWFAILDRFDVAANGHKGAAIHVHEKHGCPEWWSQMVVVGYEQARGLREKHQTPRGYQVGASKTIAAPVERAFEAFADAKPRRQWLPGIQLEVRRATKPKSLRITFVSGAGLEGYDEKPSNVDVNLYAKGDDKCMVQVQHDKLANAADGERMKAFWGEALGRLKARLEG